MKKGKWLEVAEDKWVRFDDIIAFWLNRDDNDGKAVLMIGKDKVIVSDIAYLEFLALMTKE